MLFRAAKLHFEPDFINLTSLGNTMLNLEGDY